jgi:hypothetical protein
LFASKKRNKSLKHGDSKTKNDVSGPVKDAISAFGDSEFASVKGEV